MVNALQHVGVGVSSINATYDYYRRCLGFRFTMSQTEYDVWELEPMFGRKPRMHIHNSMQPLGGPTLELFKHVDTEPRRRAEKPTWADLGLLELGFGVRHLEAVVDRLKSRGVIVLAHSRSSGKEPALAYLRDPNGILIQLLEQHPAHVGRSRIPGIRHIGLGVADLERSEYFYKHAFGYDRRVYRHFMKDEIAQAVMPAPGPVEEIVLEMSTGSTSRLSSLDGGLVKLIHCPAKEQQRIYHERRFGDPGLTEIAFDVSDIRAAHDRALKHGAVSLVPPTQFDWGFGPCGWLAYVADPDGSIIELVELKSLFKMPPVVLDLLFVRPTRLLAKCGLL